MENEKGRVRIIKELDPDGIDPEGLAIMNEFGELLNKSNERMERIKTGSIKKSESDKEDDQKRKDLMKRFKDYKKKS